MPSTTKVIAAPTVGEVKMTDSGGEKENNHKSNSSNNDNHSDGHEDDAGNVADTSKSKRPKRENRKRESPSNKEENESRRNPRRAAAKIVYADNDHDAIDDDEEGDDVPVKQNKKRRSSKSDDEDEEVEEVVDDDDDEEMDELVIEREDRSRRNPRPRRGASAPSKSTKATKAANTANSRKRPGTPPDFTRRTSSRANKFKDSLAETKDDSMFRKLTAGSSDEDKSSSSNHNNRSKKGTGKASTRRNDANKIEVIYGDDDDDEVPDKPSKRSVSRNSARQRGGRKVAEHDEDTPNTPEKRRSSRPSKGKRLYRSPNGNHRRGTVLAGDESEEESSEPEDDEDGVVGVDDDDGEEADEEDQEPLKLQRIIASRSETRATWREICQKMNTREVTSGSRWFQENEDLEDETYEERFLVKWKDLSFLHCSWETQADLEELIDGANGYLRTFFRKSHNGLLFSADERCDGDYYDPAYLQIDRILEIHLPDDGEDYPYMTEEKEDTFSTNDFGMVFDKASKKFQTGEGREFLVKWAGLPYSEASYECERDLILNDLEYKEQVKGFLRRNEKPSKNEVSKRLRQGENETRKLYKIFGDKSNITEDAKEKAVEEYKKKLQETVYKNGGQLRDYQAEGVAWMVANYVNNRSCVLADEMGLGKTLQTAAFSDILATRLRVNGPLLVIAPLSTLAHWHREFKSWTDLNVIVYHGSADDRDVIRQYEFAYECDRPKNGVAFNQTFLRKCGPKKLLKSDVPWMVDVVITTPETLVAEDSNELTAVHWELLVVDEAHRLKNHASKLTQTLKDPRFIFKHKLLLTGTPIQNDVNEFWTLVNFVDPDGFADMHTFMAKYGEMKSKETVDQLHEEIRPYILRRLKEDVEKSVPPKEETLIEVELTISQKQYYRALYEKNVKFLHKNKKALDGPSLNNLAMQLRKCCNHLFLLNGVEEEFRDNVRKNGDTLSEGDVLVRGSGKLVLLDKLLPRLHAEGHRVLIFSQFKILLDVLEDYLNARTMKFERIDGSITGKKRQQAIDRFQSPSVDGKEPPFIMMLTTRAGGVGINLTAADTCIIFDSDWNPQNDLQAQARCHRIGQEKKVQVYRLLTRKTYEMQMFHMSSLKMGLDQAVLKGFEGGGDSALSKQEIERLLRHGAYDILNEEKAGTAEDESNRFVELDIDAILEKRTTTVVHENTGSKSNAAGGTFSKASFKVAKSPGAGGDKSTSEDVDIEDPDFWKKMLGDPVDNEIDELMKLPRKRKVTNYAESAFMKDLDKTLLSEEEKGSSGSEAEDGGDDDDDDDEDAVLTKERLRWGGSSGKNEWQKEDADKLVKYLHTFGYGHKSVDTLSTDTELKVKYNAKEISRMNWALALTAILESVEDHVTKTIRRESENAVKAESKAGGEDGVVGGVLAASQPTDKKHESELRSKTFKRIWESNASWASTALQDALSYAKDVTPRETERIETALRPTNTKTEAKKSELSIATAFAQVWQSLKHRGWKAEVIASGKQSGRTRYTFEEKEYWSCESVLTAAVSCHPDLAPMCNNILKVHESTKDQSIKSKSQEIKELLEVNSETVDTGKIRQLLEHYAPLQLLVDRTKSLKLRLSRKTLHICAFLSQAFQFVCDAKAETADKESINRLAASLNIDKKSLVPHPQWTQKHDAILILAITKHGWIEQDSARRAITEDSSIKWGKPFEVDASGECEDFVRPQEDSTEVRATAKRVASFFNNDLDLISEYKGINQHLLQRSYSVNYDHTWTVDEKVLDGLLNLASEPKQTETVDLPEPKDLIRRAATILSYHVYSAVAGSGNENGGDQVKKSKHGFAVLDLSVRSNIFLAELLRGLMKCNSSNKHNKRLCTAAYKEACERLSSINELITKSSAEQRDNFKRQFEEMKQIVNQIDLVSRSMTRSSRQYKNVLRVMLGDEPLASRNPEEGFFPVDKPKPKPAAPTTSIKNAVVVATKTIVVTKTSGEIALESATRKLYARSAQENSQLSSGSAQSLDLTEIEVLILSVACSRGVPVWSNRWQDSFATRGPDSKKARDRITLSWPSFGRFVSALAQTNFRNEAKNLKTTKLQLAKLSKDRSAHARDTADLLEWNANRLHSLKEQAAAQASDYASDPDTLAKKTIMLLAKVHEFMRSIAPQVKQDGPGSKVTDWLDGQVCSWAESLDLLDPKGRPLGFLAIDFIDDLPASERSTIQVSAILDKKGCKGVVNQVAQMTKVRCFFLEYKDGELEENIVKVTGRVASVGEQWVGQPEWWAAKSQQHDALLLKRLVYGGFEFILDDAHSHGVDEISAAGVSFKDAGLTKASIQSRANQLTREIQAVMSIGDSFKRLEKVRQQRNGSKTSAVEEIDIMDTQNKKGNEEEKSTVLEIPESPEKKLRTA